MTLYKVSRFYATGGIWQLLTYKDIVVKDILKKIEEAVKNGKAEIFLLVLQSSVK